MPAPPTPDDISALLAAAHGHAEAARWAEAARAYGAVPEDAPAYGLAQQNRGAVLLRLGAAADAADAFQAALSHHPDSADAWRGLGQARLRLDQFEAAAAAYRRAVALRPGDPRLLTLLGTCLRHQGDHAGSVTACREAARLAPGDDSALANLLYAQMRACDWDGIDGLRKKLAALVRDRLRAGHPVQVRPFMAVVGLDDPDVQRAVADQEATRIVRSVTPLPAATAKPDGPITLGYLSAGLRDHPTGHLTRGLFAAHDRRRFQVVGLALGLDDGSAIRRQIAEGCDRFRALGTRPSDEIARTIRAEGVDVLVDLHGYLQGQRADIVAYRPAPIAVSYLGFPGTTGRGLHDYVLLDPVIAPPEAQGQFGEVVVTLDGGYQVNDPRDFLEPGHREDRARWDLPHGVVFCAFNMPYKIDPAAFDAWCAVLRAVEGSVLWLFDGGETVREHLRAEAGRRGLDPARLIFGKPLARAAHIRRLSAADIALDTWICGGHTSTTDCLFAGLPVVTRRGRSMAARVAASLLTYAALPDCVAEDAQGVVETATALARDPARRAAIRAHLLTGGPRLALFDLRRKVRLMEGAFEEMMRRHRAGQPPGPIHVRAG